jgi:tetratricopeptide (TPR) repeat protein
MIYTFYSYKGGVGRSMALANIAEWFYLQGLRVVIIDWDLEAPGLENFFYCEERDLEVIRSQLGLIDLLMAYKRIFPRIPILSSKSDVTRQADAIGGDNYNHARKLLQESLPPISDVLYPIHPPSTLDDREGAALWLLPAGWRSGDRFPLYAQAVQSFDWTDFYASFQGELYFEWMREQLISSVLADVVLIDSRTGVTEMGGVCTRQLADVVVSVCAPNVQNLVGIAAMARSFGRDELLEKRGRKIEIVVVPARLDVSELDARNFFVQQFRLMLDEFTPEIFETVHSAFCDLAIQYIPKYAYAEKLAIGASDSATELVDAYKKIAAHLVVLAHGESALRIRKQFAGELHRIFGSRLPSVAISYFDTEGEFLARQLRDQLDEYGLPLLPDFNQAKDKPDGWRQITGIIDQAKSMLMMVTPGSLHSEVMHKQWRYARQQGVCVYAVIKERPGLDPDLAELPKWMRNAPSFDLDRDLNLLIRDLQKPPQTMRVPFMAPEVPDNFVERRAESTQLKKCLLVTDRENQGVINVALWGPPGSGKTALAKVFCNNEDVITHYADGVLWLTLGVNPNIQAEMAKLYNAITGEARTFLDEEETGKALTEKLSDKNYLIVINDVWTSKHLQPFLSGGRRCACLFTTCDLSVVTGIGAKQIVVSEMTTSEAVQMITAELDLSPDDHRLFAEFVEVLGRSPLALRLARAALQNRIALGEKPIKALEHLRHALDKHGVIAFDQPDATERDQSVAKSIAVSLDQLSTKKRERYTQLAFFPDHNDIPLTAVSKLWGLGEFETQEQVHRLGSLALLKYDLENKTIRLNDLVRSYIRNQIPDQAGLNTKIEAGFSHLSAEEQKAARKVCSRLVRLAQIEEVGHDSRLRIRVSDLSPKLIPVVEKLVNAQIVIRGQDSASDQTIELVDDSVIQTWGRLKEWIEEDRDFLLWRQQLEASMAYWDENGRDREVLLHGSALNLARELREKRSDDLNDSEDLYINESERARRARRKKQFVVGAAIAAVVILVLGFAKWQTDRRTEETALKTSIEHIKTGNSLMSKNRVEDAIKEFQEAVRSKTDNAEAHYVLGLAYFQAGKLDKAIAEYGDAIRFKPDSAQAYLYRGRAYRRSGAVDDAIADYNRAISLNPERSDLATAYNFRGYAYYKKGDYNKALDDCDKAIEIESKYAPAYDSRASVYLAKGKIDAAINDYNRAISLNPSYVVAYSNRGRAYFEKGELDRAIVELSDALQLFDNLDQSTQWMESYIQAHFYRGLSYSKKGAYNKAIEDFTTTIQLDNNYAEAYRNRGLAYKSRGDQENAIADFQRAVALNTDPGKRDMVNQILQQLLKQPEAPRIYIRYADLSDRPRIESISQRFAQTTGYKVQRIEYRVEGGFEDVRYYYLEDKENAERIRQAFMLLLSDTNASLKLKDRSNGPGKILRGTIEVWLPALGNTNR